jgi:hypothetical protein
LTRASAWRWRITSIELWWHGSCWISISRSWTTKFSTSSTCSQLASAYGLSQGLVYSSSSPLALKRCAQPDPKPGESQTRMPYPVQQRPCA